MTSFKADLLEAKPAYRLACRITGTIVGIEYHWNTGEASVLWRDKVYDEVVRLPIKRPDVE